MKLYWKRNKLYANKTGVSCRIIAQSVEINWERQKGKNKRRKDRRKFKSTAYQRKKQSKKERVSQKLLLSSPRRNTQMSHASVLRLPGKLKFKTGKGFVSSTSIIDWLTRQCDGNISPNYTNIHKTTTSICTCCYSNETLVMMMMRRRRRKEQKHGFSSPSSRLIINERCGYKMEKTAGKTGCSHTHAGSQGEKCGPQLIGNSTNELSTWLSVYSVC